MHSLREIVRASVGHKAVTLREEIRLLAEVAAREAVDNGVWTVIERTKQLEVTIHAGIKLVLALEPSEAMVLSVLSDNESEMSHLMALTCQKVYRAMAAQLLKELDVP